MNKKSFAIYKNGEVIGYSNEDVAELVEQAVEYGVKMNGGHKEAMSIVFATIWIDGWCASAEVDEKEAQFIHNAAMNYYFI